MQINTLVLGASLKESRYSHRCVQTLAAAHIPLAAIGLREGFIDGVPVVTGFPELQNIHTVTLYLTPANQIAWYDFIFNLKPKRVIFNPGTDNPDFAHKLELAGVEVVVDCTLMMVQGARF